MYLHMSEENMSDILTSDSYTSDFEIERIGNKIMEDIPSSIGIENEIEVLDVNKESMDENLLFDIKNQKKSSDEDENHLTETNEHDSANDDVNNSVNVIDNDETEAEALISPKEYATECE